MFSLSSKGTYGIAAILELAANYGTGLLQLKDIAQQRKIPKHYLVQLLNGLLKPVLWEVSVAMNYPVASGRGIFKSIERPKGRGIKPGAAQ